ncbi:hypothetical protein [Nocardioides sp. InS609-2]|uniref:hypothetical protein n=1 Tax=Nocardioides sp. InS609-2 TaxID=2760705 RepID=UPI0020BFC891|nr:hypothetical protein [Nocardioides sp. InS609-2]
MALTTSELPDTASAVLAFARSSRAAADREEANLLVAACEWADLHPASSVLDAAAFLLPGGSEHEEPVAGPGAPLVAEFCIAEFGAVLGISTVSAKHLIGQALELRHRLPRLWRRSKPATCPPGEPGGSPRPPSTPGSLVKLRRTSTPSSPRSRTAPRPRRWTGWWMRRSPGSTPPAPLWKQPGPRMVDM